MENIQSRRLHYMTIVSVLFTSSLSAEDVHIRLVGSGSTQCSGRVEVYHNGIWGTVCDDDWDVNDAQVVCRQLGCETRDIVPLTPMFGEGIGQIWLDDVSCVGNESSLTDCSSIEFGDHDCRHYEDVGVVCSGFDIRLVGSGSTQCSGRVEVYHNGSWGTVCDDDWDLNDAQVVCRQLGCGTALSEDPSAHFGQGSGPVWLGDVRCSGHEKYLVQCEHGGLGRHHCGHDKDVGVVCEDVQIKLVGPGSTRCSGRVEVYYNGTWGRVCSTHGDIYDAQVICRQLGCETAQAVPVTGQFGEGSGRVWLGDVHCLGNENSLTQCQHQISGTHDCGYGKDAGVVCSSYQIRLAGSGSTRCSGRVEVYHSGAWGTICDDGWDLNDAQVVCRQLGCETRDIVPLTPMFGEGIVQIWLDEVSCVGNESSLTDCRFIGFGAHYCGHSEDVGVICSGSDIRLAGSGSTRCSGRVEVYHNGSWGTVCDDDWDLNDAQVVCRQLGCGTALSEDPSAHFGQGSGPVWFDNTDCTGEEESLFKCSYPRSLKCAHSEDASVVCSVSLQEPSISVTSPNEGLTWGPEGAEVIRGYSFVITCSIKANSSQGRFFLMLSDSTITDPDLKGNNSASFIFPVAQYEHQSNYTCVHQVTTKDSNSTETATISIIIKFPTAFFIRHVTLPLLLALEICVFYFYYKAKKRQMSLQVSRA